jgi:hypothetical protein
MLGGARLRLGIEDHGAGNQFVRVRSWPQAGRPALALVVILTALAGLAAVGNATTAPILLGSVAGLALTRLLYECSLACATVRAPLGRAFADVEPAAPREPKPPRMDLAHLAEQMRTASERGDLEQVAKR